MKAGSVCLASALVLTLIRPPLQTVAGRQVGVDLDVTYIEMTRPDGSRWTIDGPNGGWPLLGEAVRFRGHLRNCGDQPAGAYGYTWTVDGEVISAGVQPGPSPGAEEVLTLDWAWPIVVSVEGRISERHSLRLAVRLLDGSSELSLANNALDDTIGGLAVGFWVEQSVYDEYNAHQYANCLGKPCEGSNSWEDWAQRNLRHWNEMLATASPTVGDRVRLDKVIVVPDGALPLTALLDGKPTNTPDVSDRTVDIMWGFPARDLADSYWQSLIQDWDAGLIHELAHARGLPDQYGLNVHRSRDTLEVTDEQGRSAWGYLPDVDMVYMARYDDLMSAPSRGFFGLYSANALNSLAGRRNQGINYNPPYDDDFLSPPESWTVLRVTSNLPDDNYLRLLDAQGRPLAGAHVALYQMDSPRNGIWYAKHWDNVADLSGVADRDGLVALGHNPFGPTFFSTSPYCSGYCVAEDNWLPLLRVTYGGRSEFHFFEYTEFNLAYWRGQRERAIYEIQTAFQPFALYLPSVTRRQPASAPAR